MNTYLVEFFTVNGMSSIEVISARNERVAQDYCYEMSELPGRMPNDFEIYRLLRNSDGQLYLADCDCEPISSY